MLKRGVCCVRDGGICLSPKGHVRLAGECRQPDPAALSGQGHAPIPNKKAAHTGLPFSGL
jgi:hypothetical protein